MIFFDYSKYLIGILFIISILYYLGIFTKINPSLKVFGGGKFIFKQYRGTISKVGE
jgi:hypothetical protein